MNSLARLTKGVERRARPRFQLPGSNAPRFCGLAPTCYLAVGGESMQTTRAGSSPKTS